MMGGPGGGGGGHGPQGRMMREESEKPKQVSSTLKRFGHYVKPYWWIGLIVLVLMIISTWAQVTSPNLTGQVVDCFLTPGVSSATAGAFPGMTTTTNAQTNCWLSKEPSGFTETVIQKMYTLNGYPLPGTEVGSMTQANRIAGLGRFILIIVFLYVISSVATGLTFYGMNWAGMHLVRDLRVEIFAKVHQLQLAYYSEHVAGDMMSRITNDAETISQALNFALVNVVSGVMLLVWIMYVMLKASVAYALLSMVVMPFMIIATIYFSGQARKAFRTSRQQLGNVNAELQESISSVREVQAFNREEENIEQFQTTNAANRDANVRAVSFTSALAPTLEALGYLGLAIVTVVGGLVLLGNGTLFGTVISMGLVIMFMGYVQRFNQPIQQISVLWTNIQNAVAGAERIFNLLDEPLEVQDAPDASPMLEIKGRVEFKNVTAQYEADQPVLCNINFTAEPGQTIAIVGPTGAGKTTIINLIPRFYDVVDGSVLIDGIDVRKVTEASLRSQIGIVLQDTFLFSTTVMENIRFGRPDATDEEVKTAAKISNADTFIERLENKYETVLGERGSGLSQGQRQLISIARAALANPRILILDEATSSVDTRTERLIQKALEELLKGRTSFVIAHRLSTIRHADQLLVLDGGEIIERGKHEELLAKKGFYYDLYTSQFKRNPSESGSEGKPIPPALNLSPA
jgi:ATP-binding cassette subfamily B multidrug efflux pump